jgi:hypothetical protein
MIKNKNKNNVKKWWKSKTLHFNALVSLFAVIEANFEFIKGQNPEYYMYVVMAVSVINFYLRTITTQSVKEENVISDKDKV